MTDYIAEEWYTDQLADCVIKHNKQAIALLNQPNDDIPINEAVAVCSEISRKHHAEMKKYDRRV